MNLTLAGILAAGIWTAVGAAPPQRSGSATPLGDVHVALGMNSRRVISLVLRGSVQNGFNGITAKPLERPKALEIRVLLPAHFIKIEQDLSTTERRGFIDSVPFFMFTTPNGESNQTPDAAILRLHQVNLSRLLLGMFGQTEGPLSLRVPSSSSEATRSVRVEGPDTLVTFADLADRLPVRVRYLDDMRFPQPLSDEDRRALRMPPPPKTVRTEVVLHFEDRRSIDGMLVPHRIRQVADGVRFEELRFDEVIINPRLSPADFKR